MLIALFSRSFELLAESSVANYQLLRSQSLVEWSHKPPAPPPLRLLRLPYEICCFFASGGSLVRRAWQRSSGGGSDEDKDPELHPSDFAELRSTLFENCIEYIQAREDDVAAEDRWSTGASNTQ